MDRSVIKSVLIIMGIVMGTLSNNNYLIRIIMGIVIGSVFIKYI